MSRWTTAANTHDFGAGTTLVTGPGSNWLILRDGASYTLIDCGYPGDRRLVDASIDAAGATGLPEAVVVTHAHGDHIGTLDRYIAAGVPVHCAAAEVPNITGTAREQIGPKESLPRAARCSPGWTSRCWPRVTARTPTCPPAGAWRSTRTPAPSPMSGGSGSHRTPAGTEPPVGAFMSRGVTARPSVERRHRRS